MRTDEIKPPTELVRAVVKNREKEADYIGAESADGMRSTCWLRWRTPQTGQTNYEASNEETQVK